MRMGLAAGRWGEARGFGERRPTAGAGVVRSAEVRDEFLGVEGKENAEIFRDDRMEMHGTGDMTINNEGKLEYEDEQEKLLAKIQEARRKTKVVRSRSSGKE